MSSEAALPSPQPDTRLFKATIALSVLAHLAILLIKFGPPDPSKLFNRAALEVILVNARANTPAPSPDALAQFNLNGGGNTDEANQRIKTPLPAQSIADPSQQLNLQTKQLTQEEARQRKLLSELHNADKIIADATRQLQQQPTPGVDTPVMQRDASDVHRLEGEISQELSAQQSRPHKAFIGARTRSQPEAIYVDKWRQRVERVGTERYPVDAHGQRLSGVMLLSVEVRRDGTLSTVQIERSSGNKDLDAAAVRIVKESAPFDPIPPSVVDETGVRADYLSITRTWTFTRTGNQWTSAPPEGHS